VRARAAGSGSLPNQVQIWIYLSKYKHDPFLVRLGVAIAFISDTVCTFTIYALVYLVSSSLGGVHA
jgi:hypothetical protein